MPTGKPFVCWLSSPGKYHDVALHIGDECEFHASSGEWVRAKIGTLRKSGMYVARWGKHVEKTWMLIALRPISGKEQLWT